MTLDLPSFIATYAASVGERANKDSYLKDLCTVLGLPHPSPVTGDDAKDVYVFEKDAKFVRQGAAPTTRKIDLFKAGAFILEAKQGSSEGMKKLGTAKRETPGWNIAMKDAYGQALGYARAFAKPVPFLVVADLGYCFDVYASFDGSWDYRPFPNPQASRIFHADLAKHEKLLKAIWLDPLSLDPSKQSAEVTREVATYLANLAKLLESKGHAQETVAKFLMRCLFTMFAEDVGLLPAEAFTKALRDHWEPNPPSFTGGIESLWRTMNEGGELFTVGKILRFNGGLFKTQTALPLDSHALMLLRQAAECNWTDVEPAIFGTLLERALDPKERHRLGAHYTPRAYVERLVKPTVEEPLRADWDVVQAQVRTLVKESEAAKSEKSAKAKLKEATDAVQAFQEKLCTTRVLDPACGSGNFLYVTLDLFKRLEAEVLELRASLGQSQELMMGMQGLRVTPAQFLGIEVKVWAKEIAELVLWIGYLQWHFRQYGKGKPVPEPVLQDYGNIECRDAVLDWDGAPHAEMVRDAAGKPVMRWDGETMKVSPVTGKEVPDETATVPVYAYPNARTASWPKADFIVGNPPYLGARTIRDALGPGYLEKLREQFPSVPDNVDYVMYWWHLAAEATVGGSTRSFGLITTKSISQEFSRKVVGAFFERSPAFSLRYVVPNHPWVDSTDGAQVRVALTTADVSGKPGRLARVIAEDAVGAHGEASVQLETVDGWIGADLRVGVNILGAVALASNEGLSSVGYQLTGNGFVVDVLDRAKLSGGDHAAPIFPLISGRDITQAKRERYAINVSDLTERELRDERPAIFQWLVDRQMPERATNPRRAVRERWWVYGEARNTFRPALARAACVIATSLTAKHRVFVPVANTTICDSTTVMFALGSWAQVAVMFSRVHRVWALAAGGRLGVGDDPRYLKARCFDPYPFPLPDAPASERMANLVQRIVAHREGRQSAHAELTITGIYNVLSKLASGEALSEGEQTIHERALVSVLKAMHDELDSAVCEAYGWPTPLTDEQILERLVALNAERAEEESRGIVRWLRPEFQNPEAKTSVPPAAQPALPGTEDEAEPGEEGAGALAAAGKAAGWPKTLPEQIAAVRDAVSKSADEYSAEAVARMFKGAKLEAVVDLLDSLAALGVLVTYDLPEGRRWRAARFIG